LLTPTGGEARMFGAQPRTDRVLARVSFVAQDKPLWPWPSDRTLLLDEPLANLDPLARTEVMGQPMATVAVQCCPGPHWPPRRTTESIDALAYLAATPHTAARNGRRRSPAWRVPPPSRRRWLTIKLATLAMAALLGDAAQSLLTWTTDQFLVKPSTASPTGRC
jgi:hypothetical protein